MFHVICRAHVAAVSATTTELLLEHLSPTTEAHLWALPVHFGGLALGQFLTGLERTRQNIECYALNHDSVNPPTGQRQEAALDQSPEPAEKYLLLARNQ